MSILLNIRNLNLTFGTKVIFKDAELAINKGDRIGLIGLNGQGKSTLFNIIQKKIEPDTSTPPFICDESKEPFETFLIPQNLNIEEYKHLTVENYYLAFYPELFAIHQQLEQDYSDDTLIQKFETLGGWNIQNSYLNYLKGFELTDLTRTIEKLSGGEQRKMALSIGLSTPAELLLWDEPTNHLDIETIEKFEEELMSSNKSHLIISHDRYLLNHTTDRIFHIEKGQIITFNGTYLDYLTYLEEKKAELRKNLDKLENKHRRELAWMRQGIKARGTRSKKRVEGFQNIEAGIKEIKSKAKKVINIDLQHSGRKSKKLLEIKQGAFAYENKEIFHNLNLIVAKKDKIALIGPNGTGKSTLINLFQEKLKLKSGELRRAQELKIIVFDQHRNSLDPKISPKDLVGEGADFITLGDGRKKHIHSYLESFLFDSNQINRPIETLSGGEKNRLQLANFMKQSADLWVFDEPTNDLDIETIEILEKELKSYQAAVIIIGHDRAFLDNTCNTTWLINEQTIEVFEGGYTQVAPYLHAIEHEKKMKNIDTSKVSQKEKQQKLKLSHSEKKRLKTIDDDIMAIEEKLGELDSRLSEFNFTDMTPAKMEEYNSELSKKEELQIELDELYQEWEELHSKVDLISQNT